MVDATALAQRARGSQDGEAYITVAKEPGRRVGIGARVTARRDPDFFVEVVVDPFPDRPAIEPEGLAAQAAILERLRRRGYSLSCDDAGVVTCERTLAASDSLAEATEVTKLLIPHP